MEHVKIETLSLKNTPEINEAWVQKVIADDPTILGSIFSAIPLSYSKIVTARC